MARSQPAVDREQQLQIMTGETELARHDEQLNRQTEPQPRETGAVHRAGRPEAILAAAPRRRATPVPAHPEHATAEQIAEFGLAGPPLPAGIAHPGYDEVQRERLHPKIPPPYYSGIMAHGVPVDLEHPPNHGRIAPTPQARHGHEAAVIPLHQPVEHEPDPVPVYIVERAGGGKGRMETATDVRTAPVSGSDPIRLTSQDLRRSRVALLNEDGTNDARISKSLADLAMGKGILLKHGATTYLWIETQDDLYAVGATSAAVAISVIQEYELPGGG
jgi:hypothetical protein